MQHRLRRAFPLRWAMRWSLARMESASADSITRYQERRLRALVRLAASQSAFYREWFDDAGVDPASIRTLADLQRLPLLDRSQLVQEPDRFRVFPRQLMWAAHSSGTSGRVVTVYRTPGSSAYELSALQRQWSWFTVPRRPRSLLLRSHDPDPDRTGVLARNVPGTRQLAVSSFRLGHERFPQLLQQIRAFDPQTVEGWPSSVTILASLLRDRGDRLPVRAVITSSEVMTPNQLRLMQDVFVGPVVDHYGQTERVAMAGNCEQGSYHEFPNYGIIELVPVPGQTDRWEIVGTPLHNWGFPLFRYRTGDEIGPSPTGACACGRAFRLLGRINGRVEDAFTAANGQPIPIPSIVLDDLLSLQEVQVAQLAPGRFEFRLVPTSATDLADVQAQVRRNVEKFYGPDQNVTFRVLDHIPRDPSGKLKASIRDTM